MNPMIATLPTLAVTAIYYCWHVLYLEKCRRERVLRERVAYMLWTMALGTEIKRRNNDRYTTGSEGLATGLYALFYSSGSVAHLQHTSCPADNAIWVNFACNAVKARGMLQIDSYHGSAQLGLARTEHLIANCCIKAVPQNPKTPILKLTFII